MDQKGLARQLVAVAMLSCYAAYLSHSMFCGCHADHNCHNEDSVAGVEHVEQELAADWCYLQDGVVDDDEYDDDDDDVP